MITITKKLDMSPHGIPQVIHVSQYDSDFSIQFKLYASVGTLSIESGTTAEIRGTKGSGTGYSASATLNVSNSTVTVAGDEIENLLDVSKQIIAAVGLEAQVLEFIQNGLLCLLVAHQNNLVGVGL